MVYRSLSPRLQVPGSVIKHLSVYDQLIGWPAGASAALASAGFLSAVYDCCSPKIWHKYTPDSPRDTRIDVLLHRGAGGVVIVHREKERIRHKRSWAVDQLECYSQSVMAQVIWFLLVCVYGMVIGFLSFCFRMLSLSLVTVKDNPHEHRIQSTECSFIGLLTILCFTYHIYL